MTLHVERYNVEGFGLGEPQEASAVGVVVVGLHDRRTCPICVAWPYANGPLHLGHVAGCYLPPDIQFRFRTCYGQQGLDGLGFR